MSRSHAWKRHLHAAKHHAYRAGLAVYRWCGPVAGSIRGELSKEERQRAIGKAFIFGVTSGAPFWLTMRQPDTLTEVVVPLSMAALAGAMDAAFHHQAGQISVPFPDEPLGTSKESPPP